MSKIGGMDCKICLNVLKYKYELYMYMHVRNRLQNMSDCSEILLNTNQYQLSVQVGECLLFST